MYKMNNTAVTQALQRKGWKGLKLIFWKNEKKL